MSNKKTIDFSDLDFDEAIHKINCGAKKEQENASEEAKAAIQNVNCLAKQAVRELKDKYNNNN